MIDFKKFTLGTSKVTIERYIGAYVDGIFIRTLDTTLETWASVQPYSTVEADEIFDPRAGEHIEEIRWMYTSEKVYLNSNEETENTVSDLIIVEGKKWKPTKVEEWQHLNNGHYAVLLQKFDGY